jgi:hypothetical protein
MLLRYERVEKRVVKPSKQIRKIEITPSLHGLAGSLVTEGQLQPIGLLSDYTLIWGFRRHAAAMLRDDITHLWAAVFDQSVTEQEFQLLRATENFHRSELTPWERWQTAEELLRFNPSWKSADLAAHLHLDPGMITRLLSPGRCVPAVQDALKAGALGITDTYAMSRVPAQEQHALLAARLNGSMTNRDQLARKARKARGGNQPEVRVGRIKCPLPGPGGRSVVVSGENLTLSDVIDTLQSVIKLARKAEQEGIGAQVFERVCKDKAAKE